MKTLLSVLLPAALIGCSADIPKQTVTAKSEPLPCLGQQEEGILHEALAAYLRSPEVDEKQEAEAHTIVDQSQVVYLHYENGTPSDARAADPDFVYSIKASHVVPISHHAADGKTYRQIDLIFSKLYGDAQNASAPQWIKEMKRPLAAGYRLTSVRVVSTPTEAVKKKTSAITEDIVRDFASQIAELKAEFPELKSFDPSSVRKNGVSFSHGLGPATKAGRKKLKKNWCQVVFSLAPITGNPRAQPIPTKTYPLQATEASWKIESADSKLKERLTTKISILLKRLDAYERELSGD